MLVVTDLVPLALAQAQGDPSTSVMPFVLLGGIVVILAGGLLFVFGRRNRSRGRQ
jgi:LPXTG-motif cell wall-anchored protein